MPPNPDEGRTRCGRSPVRCEDCGSRWFSDAAKHLITLQGGCLVCGGPVSDAAGA